VSDLDGGALEVVVEQRELIAGLAQLPRRPGVGVEGAGTEEDGAIHRRDDAGLDPPVVHPWVGLDSPCEEACGHRGVSWEDADR